MIDNWIDYDQHARTCARDDLWAQVRRTVRGRPVGPDQIELITQAVISHLQLGPEDVLLDLACGNGALTAKLHQNCRSSLGVDVSPYLIEIARERFGTEAHRFVVDDGANYAATEPDPARFTKALCYGSLAYFGDEDVWHLFRHLRSRFPNLTRVMLGNLPDPDRADAFFPEADPDLREPRSSIGVWRDAEELAFLAGSGWELTTSTMPPRFFAAHYRFDAVLVRAA